ncbi:hypothetical protein ATK74_1802 [Propionicimonas paludicola]|uniref:Uncharacterized protein n=1 Tax=Propionicimonas paludicola TaxID=185243 RepID=A0A2A9CUK0_9ACTN|nr:hypothetical protein [Propionicimonas paludicola]PFG17239.1 hypothetical protein ATK74_1802 [Propionicimonas paludicola]
MKTYTLHWTYTDQFGYQRREMLEQTSSLDLVQKYAASMFAVVEPESWWIEASETVEFHDCTTQTAAEVAS